MSDPKPTHNPTMLFETICGSKHLPVRAICMIFECEARVGKKKAPKNILGNRFLYFQSRYTIEKTLAQIESDYAVIFEKKIKNKTPLSP